MTSKQQILAEIARSRSAIARDLGSVRTELDLSEHLRRSVKKRPFAWLGGAAAIGYMLAGPKTRTKTVFRNAKGGRDKGVPEPAKKAGLLVTLVALIKFLLPFIRPVLAAYASRRFGDFAEKLAR